MKTITVAVVLAFALTVFGVAAPTAEVYTWTDENGVKHFSDRRPADAKGAKPAFAEYEYDEAADKKRTDTESQELEKVAKTIDAEHEKTEQEEKQQQKEAEENRPPTMEEKVAAEREKLEQKIDELKGQPLEFFGSSATKLRLSHIITTDWKILQKIPKNILTNRPVSKEMSKYPKRDKKSPNQKTCLYYEKIRE